MVAVGYISSASPDPALATTNQDATNPASSNTVSVLPYFYLQQTKYTIAAQIAPSTNRLVDCGMQTTHGPCMYPKKLSIHCNDTCMVFDSHTPQIYPLSAEACSSAVGEHICAAAHCIVLKINHSQTAAVCTNAEIELQQEQDYQHATVRSVECRRRTSTRFGYHGQATNATGPWTAGPNHSKQLCRKRAKGSRAPTESNNPNNIQQIHRMH